MDVRYALNPVGSLVGRHLLVVEDDKDARDVFCAMLDYEGAMVLGTASAEEALRVLTTVRPHAVITGIVLHGRQDAERLFRVLTTVRPHAVITGIVLPGRDGFWLRSEEHTSE